jgi:DNA modification methylase
MIKDRKIPGIEGVQWMTGDACQALTALPDGCVDCVVTSPPYWGMRDYGIDGQYGLEPTLTAYLTNLRRVFRQLHRVLTPRGTLWLNLGDGYSCTPPGRTADPMRHSSLSGHRAAADLRASVRSAGVDRSRILPPKNLLGIPWRVALALQDDGWILRNAIVWHKPNAMPESAQDRLSRRHELLFLLVKHQRYYFNLDPVRIPYTGDRSLARRAHRRGNRPNTIQTPWPPPPTTDRKYGPAVNATTQQPGRRPQTVDMTSGKHDTAHPKGRNPGDVWTLPTRPYQGAHFATFPIDIPLRCIAAGCPPNGVVCDPFSGAGTTVLAARQLDRPAIAIDLNPAYHQLAARRLLEHLPHAGRTRGTLPSPPGDGS